MRTSLAFRCRERKSTQETLWSVVESINTIELLRGSQSGIIDNYSPKWGWIATTGYWPICRVGR